MNNYKKDFPIFTNNKDLIFLDSTASSQKPSYVIDWIKDYLENNYSNIHRWMYDIAINSEILYKKSKKIVAKHLWVDNYKEVIYTYNSTYALNLLSSSLKKSDFLKAWDKVLLSIVEHHANVVPWLILKEEIGIEVEFVNVDSDFNLDLEDFDEKYDSKVKVISMTHVSNVTWQIFDLKEIGKRKREDTIFIVDWSQSIPHFKVNVKDLNCDALFFTGHKIFADSWIGVLWWKEELLNSLTPSFSWGWAIWEVTCNSYTSANLPDKFEPGTPNVSWAVSILRAFEYVENIGWFTELQKHEDELVSYFLEKFKELENVKIIWSNKSKNRVWVFSLFFEWKHSHDIAEILADNNIAVRSWKHCAHPLLSKLWFAHSVRISFHLYNSKEEIDKLFNVLKNIK